MVRKIILIKGITLNIVGKSFGSSFQGTKIYILN